MHLVIDIGNTYTKAALFANRKLIEQNRFKGENKDRIASLIKVKPIHYAIISSVKNTSSEFVNYVTTIADTFLLNPVLKLPIKLNYESANTLGADRIAAASGAFSSYRGEDVLAITAGSCLTYNMVKADGTFVGGAISPGLMMRYKALNFFTDKLPLVEDENFNELIGDSTKESILSGVRRGIVAEMDGVITQYKERYDDLKVVLTGGDTVFFEARLKNEIFADFNLVLKGLNEIVFYNK